MKSARQKEACKPDGTVQQGTRQGLCKAAISCQKQQQDRGWQQAPGHQGTPQERCCQLQSWTGRRRTKQRTAESCFSQLSFCHRAGSQEPQWVTMDETISWVRQLYRKYRCEQRKCHSDSAAPTFTNSCFYWV